MKSSNSQPYLHCWFNHQRKSDKRLPVHATHALYCRIRFNWQRREKYTHWRRKKGNATKANSTCNWVALMWPITQIVHKYTASGGTACSHLVFTRLGLRHKLELMRVGHDGNQAQSVCEDLVVNNGRVHEHVDVLDSYGRHLCQIIRKSLIITCMHVYETGVFEPMPWSCDHFRVAQYILHSLVCWRTLLPWKPRGKPENPLTCFETDHHWIWNVPWWGQSLGPLCMLRVRKCTYLQHDRVRGEQVHKAFPSVPCGHPPR